MTTSARSSYQEDSMPDIDVKPIVQEVTVPMAPGITEAHHGPMVAAHLIIRGVHRCGGRAETCAESCMVTIAVVLVDPDTGPGADPPPTIGWIQAVQRPGDRGRAVGRRRHPEHRRGDPVTATWP